MFHINVLDMLVKNVDLLIIGARVLCVSLKLSLLIVFISSVSHHSVNNKSHLKPN